MANYTVLVIDDEKEILDAARLVLEQGGFAVVTAENCSDAFDYLKSNQPDAIVSDLMIPDMTGLEFIHQIRRVCNFDRIPIIAMSAYDRAYLAAAILAGAESVLHKPEDLSVLLETVNRAVGIEYKRDAAGATGNKS